MYSAPTLYIIQLLCALQYKYLVNLGVNLRKCWRVKSYFKLVSVCISVQGHKALWEMGRGRWEWECKVQCAISESESGVPPSVEKLRLFKPI